MRYVVRQFATREQDTTLERSCNSFAMTQSIKVKGTPDSQAFPSEIVACPYVQTSLIPSGGDRKYFGSAVTIRSGDLTVIT